MLLKRRFSPVEEWPDWKSSVRKSMKNSILSPISDIISCLASISNSCLKDVGKMVIACSKAKPLKLALRDLKQSASHCCGNEKDKVYSAISSEYRLKSLNHKQLHGFAFFCLSLQKCFFRTESQNLRRFLIREIPPVVPSRSKGDRKQ